jgi:hypothetical protein
MRGSFAELLSSLEVKRSPNNMTQEQNRKNPDSLEKMLSIPEKLPVLME